MKHLPFLALAALLAPLPAAYAQTAPAAAASMPPPYADIADQVVGAPMILDATIRSTSRIGGTEAAGVAPGTARIYVEADVGVLVRGGAAVPPRIGYVLDAPADARGRPPRYRKARVMLFARPVAGTAGQVQLVDARGQREWTPALDALVRRIAAEVAAPEAAPAVTGIRNAFHVAGSLPGEGETQIFLATADDRPVSLSILRRPGEPPRWAVALGEIVDDSAAPPARDTLLWYRLACALPAALPDSATATLPAPDAAAAREDYAVVVARLGPCGRTAG